MNNDWRILVVEDDPDGQEVVATILEHLGIALDVAADAEQAEELLFAEKVPYSAAIIDLALPGKDGWELLGEIQNTPATANLPCIAVTAYHTFGMREDALVAAFSAYFPKPIEATSFARQLEEIL